jgi:polyhydroxyalkanoate synthase
MQAFWRRQMREQTEQGFSLVEPSAVSEAFFDFATKLMASPGKLAEAQMAYWQTQAELWQRMLRRAGGEEVQPLIEPARGDRRFKDKAWDDDLLFDYLKQSYLLSADWIRGVVDNVDGQDPEVHDRVAF